MRVTICAVGRLRAGPEHELISDYLQRFDRTGRALGLGPAKIIEVEDKKGGGMAAEAELLARAIPQGALTVTLDERGRLSSSPEFAADLAGWRDAGRQDLAIVIGGADGLAPALRDRAAALATPDVVSAYQHDGAVVLRGVLHTAEVQRLARGIDANLATPGPRAIVASRTDDPGFFIEDFCNWQHNADYRATAFDTPLPDVAARLMHSRQVRLYQAGRHPRAHALAPGPALLQHRRLPERELLDPGGPGAA
jgi:23S rRNA (pseudouridine1915-N3)-methyltransferase